MNKSIVTFILTAILGLGLGFIIYDVILGNGTDSEVATSNEEATDTTTTKTEEKENEDKSTETATAENILQTKGCIGCHAVEGLGLPGGATGPDLSQAYNNVEGKHGKPINEFLKEPTSAVMSSVISGSPLSDDEITQIVEELKKASEAK